MGRALFFHQLEVPLLYQIDLILLLQLLVLDLQVTRFNQSFQAIDFDSLCPYNVVFLIIACFFIKLIIVYVINAILYLTLTMQFFINLFNLGVFLINIFLNVILLRAKSERVKCRFECAFTLSRAKFT